jgi:glycosyltransferase involved in cell wall biosynthesis
MKIAIDISSIVYGTGVSVYTKNLAENLISIDSKNEYILFGYSLRRQKELKEFLSGLKKPNLIKKVFPLPPSAADFIWNRIHKVQVEKLIGTTDVFHSSDWTQPPSSSFKVTTIHDLVPVKYPKLSHRRIVSVHNARLKWALEEVDRVIVPTQTTFEDAQRFGFAKENLRLIPEAVDPIFRPAKRVEIERLKRKYRISGNYILSIGVNSRKNISRLIEAFEKVEAEADLRLVILGSGEGNLPNIRGIIFVGHVPRNEVPVFYSGAHALVYPSLYEGFGLPILEAFACKTPVVTSNLGSMKETAGNAAILVDPYDINSISEGIKKALLKRNILVNKGKIRESLF